MDIVRRNALLSLNAARIQTICEASARGYKDLTFQYFEDALSALVDLVEYDKRGSIVINNDTPNLQGETLSGTNTTSPQHAQNSPTPPTCSQSLRRSVSQKSGVASSGTES